MITETDPQSFKPRENTIQLMIPLKGGLTIFLELFTMIHCAPWHLKRKLHLQGPLFQFDIQTYRDPLRS